MLAAARAGDAAAFAALTGPHRQALLAHCYRMLGSLDDADDAVQDTLLRAWRKLLGFSAAETAAVIGASAVSVNNTLLRARSGLAARLPPDGPDTTPTAVRDELVDRYVRAWHAADVAALVALLREDADMSMPPTPSWCHSRDHIGIYLQQVFASPWGRGLRLLPTAANRQPALASTPRQERRRRTNRSQSRC